MVRICLVTSNANKLREIVELLEGTSVTLRSVAIDLLELQGTCESITKAKCKQAWNILNEKHDLLQGEYVMVDDVAMELDALSGNPGPYIKDFLKNMSLSDLHAMCQAVGKTGARAIATFGLYNGAGEPIIVTGECLGSIIPPCGETTFGWDPIFQPAGESRSFAQMSGGEKSAVSHRGDACRKISTLLSTLD